MATQSFKYKLTLGNRISGTAKELVLMQGESLVFSDNNKSYLVTLLGIKINRKIYQPCEVVAELDFMQKGIVAPGQADSATTSAPSFNDVTSLLLQRQVRLEIIEMAEVGYGMEKTGSYTIAENYFVFEVNPQMKRDINGIKMYVKLNIFSMDKLMTLTKYSKAYVAKKLGSTILKTESKLYGMQPDNVTPLILTDTSHMKMLRYNERLEYNNKDVLISSEFIQPYLVQYNETFYDFLVRTSNRCGEFLFFENGYVTLGLPDVKEPNANKKSEDIKEPFEIKDYETVTMQDSVPETRTVGCFSRDSMKDSATDIGALNQTEIKPNEAGYPKDIFPDQTSSNAELAHDEYLFPLFKDKFTSKLHQLHYDEGGSTKAKWVLLPWVKTWLANPMNLGVFWGLPELVVWGGISATVAHGVPNIGLAMSGIPNDDKNKHHIIPYEQKIEQSKDNKVVQFGTVDPAGWTTVNYYQNVRQYEEQALKKTICIDMGTAFVDVKLGQRIKVSGLDDTYIVIQIEQTSEEKWDRHYDKYNAQSNDMLAGARSQKIYAVPGILDKNNQVKYFPPLQPVPIIRKVGPQTAFVTDNDDPKFQGRVRIVYPWQSMNKDLQKKLKEYSSQLEIDEEKLRNLKKDKWEKTSHIINLEKLIPQLITYCTMSKEDRKQKLNSLNEEIKTLDNKILSKEKEKAEKAAILKALKDKDKKTLTRNEIIQKGMLEYKLEKLEQELTELKVERTDKNKIIEDMVAAALDYDKHKREKDYNLEAQNPVIKKYSDDLEKTRAESKGIPKQEKIAEEKVESRKKIIEETKEKDNEIINSIASPWVRVATPMASTNGGTFFKPIIGDEVLINYDNDNVERPYVVGSLFSKNHLVPEEQMARYQTPNSLTCQDIAMTLQSHNGHHIIFNDPQAGWPFFAEAISPGVSNLARGTLASLPYGESFKDMGGGIHIGDKYGIYELELNSSKRKIFINSPFGSVELNAFTGIELNAPNGDVKITGKNVTIEAGNKVNITSGMNIIETMGDPGIALLGQIFIEGAWTEVLKELLVKSVDVKIIRYVYETFLKPVDGTMTMKSKRYLKLEAGPGTAQIQRNRYNKFKMEYGDGNDDVEFFRTLVDIIQKLDESVDDLYQTVSELRKSASEAYLTYRNLVGLYYKTDPNLDFANKISDMAERVKAGKDCGDLIIKPDSLKGELNMDKVKEDEVGKVKNDIVNQANECIHLASLLKYHVDGFPGLIMEGIKEVNKGSKFEINYIPSFIREFIEDKIESFKWENDNLKRYFEGSKAPADVFFAEANKTLIKRQLIVHFLYAVSQIEKNSTYFHYRLRDKDLTDKDLASDYWWHQLVNKIDKKVTNYFGRELAKPFILAGQTVKKAVRWDQGDRDYHWADGKGGQILFSDQPDSTLNFEGGKIKEENINQGTIGYLKYCLWGIK